MFEDRAGLLSRMNLDIEPRERSAFSLRSIQKNMVSINELCTISWYSQKDHCCMYIIYRWFTFFCLIRINISHCLAHRFLNIQQSVIIQNALHS